MARRGTSGARTLAGVVVARHALTADSPPFDARSAVADIARVTVSRLLLPGLAAGPVRASDEGLSFWGGVDPATTRVIDARHPLAGQSLAGAVLIMPTSRGSCSGSGVWLDMALNGRAPAALVLREGEEVLTLGARIAWEMFGVRTPVVRLSAPDFAVAARASHIEIGPQELIADGAAIPLQAPASPEVALDAADRATLAGSRGEAAALAMRVIVAMAAQQGAARLVDVTRAHIDGCIYASPANLAFAERMAALGARVAVPATTNAISVDRERWRAQGVAPDFGEKAARLADAYLDMGCTPSFTCAPYLRADAPKAGECIAWAESNAVIYANAVLGARTAKHPDFLDLCIALTGRAPLAGPYLDESRRAEIVLEVEWPAGADDSIWPLVGWLAGRAAPDRVPALAGLGANPSPDDLKALCAAFGTTSAAPMLVIEGVTPDGEIAAGALRERITRADLAAGWRALNDGPAEVDLVAIGSPHASRDECRRLADLLQGERAKIPVLVTCGRDTRAALRAEGVLARLEASGVKVVPDLCWCSISEPVLPPATRVTITNSAKYAHYGPGLHGRRVRMSSLADCVTAALEGVAPARLPAWLA